MNVLNNAELNAVANVEQLGDFLFSVLDDGITCMFQEIDELVIDMGE